MNRTTLTCTVAAAAAIACAVPIVAGAQQGPPPPTAANGNAVKTLAQGVPIPIAFAFGGGKVFVAAGGSEDGKTPGGVFLVSHGKATMVPGTKGFVAGLTWRRGVLYASIDKNLVAWSDWNKAKKRFDSKKVIYKGAKNFSGFAGLAFGPNRRLYAGVALDFKYDHAKSPQPLAQRVVSMNADGTGLATVARGLRQPWQLTFVRGVRAPFVSVLAQDNREPPPPDYIVKARNGQDYGFPGCTREKPNPCKGFARPFKLLPQHASPMGIDAIGKRLYVALFGRLRKQGPEVVSISSSNRKARPKPVLTGFAAPVVALGTYAGRVYTGDLTGAIYRVKP
jgi:glucose/arabinose dehydrogenase